MSITYTSFFVPTVLTTSAATLYAMPAAAGMLLRGARIRLTNTTGTAATATLYAVPGAGTAGVANAFLFAKSVGANDFLDVDVPILPAGSTLQALAGTATAITAHMLGGSLFLQ
jgi:hypothetical protein